MTREVRVSAASLPTDLPAVLAQIAAGAVVFVEDRDGAFVLGPAEVCGQVVGLVDEEYGWPTPVKLADVRSVDDLRPGHRCHPFLHDGHSVVAVAIGADEYAQIRARAGDSSLGAQ